MPRALSVLEAKIKEYRRKLLKAEKEKQLKDFKDFKESQKKYNIKPLDGITDSLRDGYIPNKTSMKKEN